MNNEEIKSLKPDKGVCRDCAGEIGDVECAFCGKNLFSYKLANVWFC